MSFLSDAEITLAALDKFLKESQAGQAPVIHQLPLPQLVATLKLDDYVRKGGLTGPALDNFLQAYLASATRLHHPDYMAHQVAVPYYSGSLGAMIDGLTNNAMAIYEMGPGAASIEYYLVNWMLEKAGWQPAPLDLDHLNQGKPYGAGVLTHGGSLANLTALTAARTRLVPQVWEEGLPGDLAILASPESHYSVARSAGILGIGRNSIYQLEADQFGVVLPERLPDAYRRLRQDGKRAVALVASACSTGAGLYDPLREMAAFCRAENIWFHVDGAHGASALLSDKQKYHLDGLELADSLVWDAHKMLRAPTLCAAVLVRDHASLDHAFEQEASYLFHEKDQPGFDFIHRTVECTKAGLGLRLFMVLGALGEKGLAEYIDRQVELAFQAYEYIRQQPGFECPVAPQTNIVCFRLTSGDDHAPLRLRDQLIARGSFHISTTEYMGKRYMRLALMNPDTSLDDIRRLIAEIREIQE